MIDIQKYKNSIKGLFTWKVKVIILLPFILSTIGFFYFQYGTMTTIENVRISNLDSKDGIYYIFTNIGTFKNVDSWWHFKTRSSDYQGIAAIGDITTIKVYGVRSGFGSLYKNIISIEVQK